MIVAAATLFIQRGTIQGVPTSVVLKFLADEPARDAYFSGQSRLLHDRLQEMSIEEEVKAFYRPQFEDEAELDWYVHQIFYERSGYVGKAYKVGPNQRLTLKTLKDRQYPQWIELARKSGLVVDQQQDDAQYYVQTAQGSWITYEEMSDLYPLPELRQMIRRQKKARKQQLKKSRR